MSECFIRKTDTLRWVKNKKLSLQEAYLARPALLFAYVTVNVKHLHRVLLQTVPTDL